MAALPMHVSSFILHSPVNLLENKIVGTPRLNSINNKKQQQGPFSRSRLILSSGTANTIIEMGSESSKGESRNAQKSATSGVEELSKDNQLVFVAGATGKVGSRTVSLAFVYGQVCVSLQKAEALLESVAQLKMDSQGVNPSVPLRPTEEKNIEIAVCDLEKPNEITPALGRAGVGSLLHRR
ncbi:hypothetical protein KI387_014480, partial [Taxus chinensis]